MAVLAFDPFATFLDVKPDGGATLLPVDAEFWQGLASGRIPLHGSLFCFLEFDGSWSHWESHPAGDELILLLGGSAEIELEVQPEQMETIHLNAETSACLMPRGSWHRVRGEPGSRLAFLTPGEGTQHR